MIVIQIKQLVSGKHFFTYVMPKKDNKLYKVGIENLLNLPDNFDYSKYEKTMVKEDDYGLKSIIKQLDKTKLCEDICSSNNAKEYLIELKNVLSNIEKIMNEWKL